VTNAVVFVRKYPPPLTPVGGVSTNATLVKNMKGEEKRGKMGMKKEKKRGKKIGKLDLTGYRIVLIIHTCFSKGTKTTGKNATAEGDFFLHFQRMKVGGIWFSKRYISKLDNCP
jgi:hypothetical protein